MTDIQATDLKAGGIITLALPNGTTIKSTLVTSEYGGLHIEVVWSPIYVTDMHGNLLRNIVAYEPPPKEDRGRPKLGAASEPRR